MNKYIFIGLLTIVLIGLLAFIFTLFSIRNSVFQYCLKIDSQTSGNCREDMEKILTEEKQPFRQRNRAIWVLGQLADKKSLPVLKKHFIGNIPPRESLDKTLSQYELQKAIRWCEQGNITSWMYRGF